MNTKFGKKMKLLIATEDKNIYMSKPKARNSCCSTCSYFFVKSTHDLTYVDTHIDLSSKFYYFSNQNPHNSTKTIPPLIPASLTGSIDPLTLALTCTLSLTKTNAKTHDK